MTQKQKLLYWRLWAGVRRTQPDLERKALHAELGLPESHKFFSNEALDTWKQRCLAIAEPANFKAQLAQLRMPATRRRHTISRVAAALGDGENYVEGIVKKMNPSRPFVTLETLDEDGLQPVLIALKKKCRRRWRNKPELLETVNDFAAKTTWPTPTRSRVPHSTLSGCGRSRNSSTTSLSSYSEPSGSTARNGASLLHPRGGGNQHMKKARRSLLTIRKALRIEGGMTTAPLDFNPVDFAAGTARMPRISAEVMS